MREEWRGEEERELFVTAGLWGSTTGAKTGVKEPQALARPAVGPRDGDEP